MTSSDTGGYVSFSQHIDPLSLPLPRFPIVGVGCFAQPSTPSSYFPKGRMDNHLYHLLAGPSTRSQCATSVMSSWYVFHIFRTFPTLVIFTFYPTSTMFYAYPLMILTFPMANFLSNLILIILLFQLNFTFVSLFLLIFSDHMLKDKVNC